MNQLVQVYTDIYKPVFDTSTDKFVDKSPYRAYERNCIRYECRCRAGSYFIGNSQFKQHCKSKTHKDFVSYYKKYYKENDEATETIKTLTADKELLLRKNQMQENNLAKLQIQNKHLLEVIEDLNDDMKFEECS